MKNLLLIFLLCLSTKASYSQNIPTYVPDSGLLAWYPFNGNAIDSSGNGWDGTVNGAVLTTDRCGNANNAYRFSDTNNISTLLLPPTGNGARTISCWFQYDSLPHPCNTGMVIAGYGANNSGCFQVAKNYSLEVLYTGMPPTLSVDGVCVEAHAAGGSSDTLDTGWHFFAAVYDPSTGPDYNSVKIYQDCSFRQTTLSIFSNPIAVNTDSLSRFLIGRGHYQCKRNFHGKIDDIGVWDRALTATELSALCSVCSPASVKKTERSEHIDVYPNPANNKVTIQSEVPVKKVVVLSITGQVLLSQEFNAGQASIDVSSLDAGIYFMRINDTYVHKMVKQ